MVPFNLDTLIGHLGNNLLYIFTGILFGIALERAGFGNSRNLAAQFYLKDMRVLKVMFTAIIVAMLLIFWTSALGILDFDSIWVNPTYLWPGIIGGLIFGMGFVIGGYCPGTALVSMATLKIDGLFFIIGLCVGIFIFGESVDSIRVFWEKSGNYGRVTLPQWLNVQTGTVVFGVTLMALGMFWGAEKLEHFFAVRKNAEGSGK